MSEIPLSRDTQERKDHVHKYKTKMTYRNEYKTRMTYKNEHQTACICDSVQLVAKRVGEQNVWFLTAGWMNLQDTLGI